VRYGYSSLCLLQKQRYDFDEVVQGSFALLFMDEKGSIDVPAPLGQFHYVLRKLGQCSP
jgi:hypothetical protein